MKGKKPLVEEARGAKPKRNYKMIDAVKFAIMFGCLFRRYFDGKVNGIGKDGKRLSSDGIMLILDTMDDLGADISQGGTDLSNFLNANIIKVFPIYSKNWYDDGIRVMQYLKQNNINVAFGQAHDKSQAGFKVVIRKG